MIHYLCYSIYVFCHYATSDGCAVENGILRSVPVAATVIVAVVVIISTWNTQDHDINSPVFPLFVVVMEQPETRLYFVQFSIPLRHGYTTAT
jgi:hypothetical protein